MKHDISVFLKSLYRTQKVNRFGAWRMILRYQAACRTVFPPRKTVWGKFYNEPRGAYIHKALAEHFKAKQFSFCCYCRDRIYHRKIQILNIFFPLHAIRCLRLNIKIWRLHASRAMP